MKELSTGMKFKHSADKSITFDLYIRGTNVVLEAESNPNDCLVYGCKEFNDLLNSKVIYEA